METNKIIHVRLKEPYNGQEDYFFGSLKAMCEVLPREVVGLAYTTLNCRFAKSGHCLETKTATIKAAQVIRCKRTK